jgi:DNA-binding NarL/FixJ family response regulator
MISVLLVDEHEVVRRGVKAILNSTSDIMVRAEAANIDDMGHLLGSDSDDLLITELAMVERGGIDVIRRIRRRYANIKIMVLTSDRCVEVADRALKAGAKGYITKDSSANQILEAIRNLARGRLPISEAIAEQLMLQLVGVNRPDGYQSLTTREMDIFLMIARGTTCTQIANSLSLSIKTVSTHKSRIMDKLRFSSTADLVQYAVAHKLIAGYVI